MLPFNQQHPEKIRIGGNLRIKVPNEILAFCKPYFHEFHGCYKLNKPNKNLSNSTIRQKIISNGEMPHNLLTLITFST